MRKRFTGQAGLALVVLLAGSGLAAVAHGQTVSAWRTEWSAFVPALQQCVQNDLGCSFRTTEFLNGTVSWEGRLIEMRNRTSCPVVIAGGDADLISQCAIVEMPSGGSISVGGSSYTVNPRLTVFPTAEGMTAWQALRPGPVRFQASLSAVFFTGSAFSSRSVEIGLSGGIANPPAGPPSIHAGGVRSLSNGNPLQISAGTWFVIEGSNLSEAAAGWREADVESGQAPVELAGTRVMVNGKAAGLLSVSPTRIFAIGPSDDALGRVDVSVTRGNAASAPVTVELAPFSPGLLAFAAKQGQYAAALHENGAVAAGGTFFSNATGGSTPARPARVGAMLALLATGLGITEPATDGRTFFEGLPQIVDPTRLEVRIGGQQASVAFAGLAGSTPPVLKGLVDGWPALDRAVPGLYALLVQVPDSLPSGDHPVALTMDGSGGATDLLLTVAGADAPVLQASLEEVRFEWRQGSATPAARSVELTTDGAAASFEAVARNSWVRVSPGSGSAPRTLTISVVPQGLSPGTHTPSVVVASSEAANGFVMIRVSLTVTEPVTEVRPELRGPASLTITFAAGTAAPPAVPASITSSGTAISFAVNVTGNVAVTPSPTTTPATLQVRATNTAQLAAGTYRAELQLVAPAAANSPLRIPVTITVQPAPTTRTVTLREAIVARTVTTGTCNAPEAVTQFTPADAQVNVWYTVVGAAAGDQAHVEFVTPTGSVQSVDRYDPFDRVYGCFIGSMRILGTTAATRPGTWTARIFWNNTLIGTRSFTIAGLGLDHYVFTKTVPPAECETPFSGFTFSLADANAYFWMLVRGHQAGDVTKIEWVSPANIARVRTIYSPLPSGGTYCASSRLPIQLLLGPGDVGSWKVRVTVNDVLLIEVPFVIAPVTIRNFAMTRSVPLNVCSFPEQATVFRRTDGYAALWFQASNAVAGHVASADWIAPDGTVAFSSPAVTIASSGNACQSFSLLISGNSAAQKAGVWRVVLRWNGTAIGSLSFTIQ